MENRRLLAVAAFQVEAYSDDDGSPGPLIADNTVTAGDTFYLRITVQEFDRFRDGLGSVAVNVDWDPNRLSGVESSFQLDAVITSDLPMLQSGSLDNQAGSIEDLSGTALLSSGAGRAIGNGAGETFALIRMQAGSEPGTTTIDLSKSQKKTITVPTTVLGQNDLRFDAETIEIVQPVAFAANSLTAESSPVETVESDTSAASDPIATASATPPDEAPVPEQPAASEPARVIQAQAEPEPELVLEADSTFDRAPDRLALVVRPRQDQPSATEPISQQQTVASVDEALSFDLNEDGVFDFGDFGLLNLSAVAPVADSADSPSTDSPSAAMSDSAAIMDVAWSQSDRICFAVPPHRDVAAFESWLEALARAWLADADAREHRPRGNSLF